jgi:hypothetical protein
MVVEGQSRWIRRRKREVLPERQDEEHQHLLEEQNEQKRQRIEAQQDVVAYDSYLFEAGLFESKIRIRYACVHLGGFTKEISSSH